MIKFLEFIDDNTFSNVVLGSDFRLKLSYIPWFLNFSSLISSAYEFEDQSFYNDFMVSLLSN